MSVPDSEYAKALGEIDRLNAANKYIAELTLKLAAATERIEAMEEGLNTVHSFLSGLSTLTGAVWTTRCEEVYTIVNQLRHVEAAEKEGSDG